MTAGSPSRSRPGPPCPWGRPAVGDVLGRGSDLRTHRGELVCRLLPRIEYGELVLGLDQAARHREAHLPEANESDFHGVIPFTSSLRAKRSNPFFLCAARWIASLRSQ